MVIHYHYAFSRRRGVKLRKCYLLLFIIFSIFSKVYAVETDKLLSCNLNEFETSLLISAKVDIESFIKTKTCAESFIPELVNSLKFLYDVDFNEEILKQDNPVLMALQSPWDFFIRSYDKMVFHESKTNYASFDNISKIMRISFSFFEESLVFSSGVLIHEAAHARPTDQGHVQCWRGDLRFSYGSCDSRFDNDMKRAGAYSFHTWYWIALANFSKNLSFDDKQEAFERAKSVLVTRFNFVLDHVSMNDLLVVLRDDGIVSVLDPLTRKLIQVSESEKDLDEEFVTLSKDNKNSGVSFINTDGVMSNWSPITMSSRKVFKDTVDKVTFPLKNRFMGYSYSDRITRTVLLDFNGIAWILESDSLNETKKYVKYDFINQFGRVKDVKLIIGQYLSVLYENGSIKIFDGIKFLDKGLDEVKNAEKLVVDGNFRSLFYIDDKGELFKLMRLEKVITSGISTFERYDIKKVETKKLKDYAEGFSYKAYLDLSGKLEIVKTDNTGDSPTLNPYALNEKFKALAFTNNVLLDSNLNLVDEKIKKGFKKECRVTKIIQEPWLNRLLGINNKQELVSFNEEDNSCEILYKEVKEVSVHYSDLAKSRVGVLKSILKIDFLNADTINLSGY